LPWATSLNSDIKYTLHFAEGHTALYCIGNNDFTINVDTTK